MPFFVIVHEGEGLNDTQKSFNKVYGWPITKFTHVRTHFSRSIFLTKYIKDLLFGWLSSIFKDLNQAVALKGKKSILSYN